MKNVKMEKYLGDQISSEGLADSAHATILETVAVVEDCRANVLGGILAGL